MQTEFDHQWLRRSFELAIEARQRGDHPFGAVLVAAGGELLAEGGNLVVSRGDFSAHAELALLQAAWLDLGPSALAGACLYSSCEPCPMCAGAAHWSGLGRVVFGLRVGRLYELMGAAGQGAALMVECRQLLAQSGRPIEVLGPQLHSEAERVHAGFWASGA